MTRSYRATKTININISPAEITKNMDPGDIVDLIKDIDDEVADFDFTFDVVDQIVGSWGFPGSEALVQEMKDRAEALRAAHKRRQMEGVKEA